MFTGTVINDLMAMVARVEDQAQEERVGDVLEREDRLLAAHFAYHSVDSRLMTSGVA